MYDIVIVAHNKDFNKIKYVIEYAEKNFSWQLVTDKIIQAMENFDLQEQLGNE